MAESLEKKLVEVLNRLETAATEIRRSHEVTRETETMKVLVELVREQIRHEDPRHTVRPVG